MGDVREGTAVDEGGVALQGLHQIRLQGVLQQGAHGPFGLKVMGGHGLIIIGVAHHDASQALFQVSDGGCQAEDGHDLGGHGDIEAVFPRHPVGLAAQAIHDVPELAVVHIYDPLPGDAAHIYVQLIAILDMSIQHSRQKVIGCSDGMEVAREMQVDILHGDHLGIAASRRSPLDAENGAQRRLPQGHHHILPSQGQRVSQTDGGSGLPFARRSGIDSRHQDELSRLMGSFGEQVVVHLRLVLPIGLQMILADPQCLGHIRDPLGFSSLCDLNVCEHPVPPCQPSWLL